MHIHSQFATIKAILFDCDGTLVDSEHAHFMGYKLAVQELGGDLLPEEYTQFVGISDQVVSKWLAAKIGIDNTAIISQKKKLHFRRLCSQGLPAIEATVDFLKYLGREKKRLGIKIGVCSAAGKEDILTHLRHLNVDGFLDVILSGADDLSDYCDDEGVNKPKPYIYLQAVKMLGILPKQCVVIEDSIPGVTAGVSAGCHTIAVPNDHTRNHDLSLAHFQVDSFAKIDIDRFLQSIDNAT